MDTYGITIPEIIAIITELADETLENAEDGGKLDSKEIVLLVKLLIDRLIEASDDETLDDRLGVASKVLGIGARFVPGDGI